jgi:hypothetical protein
LDLIHDQSYAIKYINSPFNNFGKQQHHLFFNVWDILF